MKLIIDSVHYNLTAEDLENSTVEFSFWKGRRFTLPGEKKGEHLLRYNDMLKAALSENVVFNENEDQQRIYKALSNLKDKGYPYNGFCVDNIMLWFMQLIGNQDRDALLIKLQEKLCQKNEETNESEEIPSEDSSVSIEIQSEESSESMPNYSEIFNFEVIEKESENIESSCLTTDKISLLGLNGIQDILPAIFKQVGRGECLSVRSTCKLFYELYGKIEHLQQYFSDFNLLKQGFLLNTVHEARKKNEIYLLLSEFNISQVNFDSNTDVSDHLHYAIRLAKKDPKSALKILLPILKSYNGGLAIQALSFCCVAAIHKNSTLCKEEGVMQMGTEVTERYLLQTWHQELENEKEKTRIINLLAIFEAFHGLDNKRAIEVLSRIKNYHLNSSQYLEENIKKILNTIKYLKSFEGGVQEKIIELLNTSLGSVRVLLHNRSDLVRKIAKTLSLFDLKKSLAVLEESVSQFRTIYENQNPKNDSFLLVSLAQSAKDFSKLDQDRAFTLAQETFENYEKLLKAAKPFEGKLVFESLNQILKIFEARDKKYALKMYEKSKALLLDSNYEKNLMALEILYPDHFILTLEAFALLKPEEALELTQKLVDKLKQYKKNGSEHWFLNINKINVLSLDKYISNSFPEEAVKILDLIGNPLFAIMALARKRISSKIARAYVRSAAF
ncbi:MAG: hypothetical protein H0T62_07615 [Parachlamydiaceae bacterium]|nr:hypothetical protein [Parachlamydiaceae bacterium]